MAELYKLHNNGVYIYIYILYVYNVPVLHQQEAKRMNKILSFTYLSVVSRERGTYYSRREEYSTIKQLGHLAFTFIVLITANTLFSLRLGCSVT